MSSDKSTDKYIELDWEEPWSPLYGSPIILPENLLLWRSYDKSYETVGDRFAYYSSVTVARGYTKNTTRQLGCFTSTKPLKVLDLRFLKVLLSRLIQTNSKDKAFHYFGALIISFGLCSLKHQIELVKLRYKGLVKNSTEYKYTQLAIKSLEEYYKPHEIFEQAGTRIAETTNDIFSMGFLQELFKGKIDGFISPRISSPFHIEKNSTMSPELILFNPKDSGIVQLLSLTSIPKKTITIQNILYSNHGYIILENIKKNGIDMNIKMDFFMYGGDKIEEHYMDKADDLLNIKDKDYTAIYNNSKKAGKLWRNKLDISMIESPSPCMKVTPFKMD